MSRRHVIGAAGAALLAAACANGPSRLDAASSDPALDARLARAEARADAAEAVRAVKRLQHAYGMYLESGLWDDLADLFTDDAAGEWGAVKVEGKDALRAHFMAEAGRTTLGLAPDQLNEHLQLQPIVTLGADGVTAKAAFHEIAMLGKRGVSADWLGGVYENEYRLDGGAWKISRIRFIEQYRGPYEDWGHKAPAAWNIPYHFEAAHVGVTIPAGAVAALSASPEKGSPASRVARLEARAQRMSDETAVANLEHAFGYYLDRKMYDDVADLFTDDGIFAPAGRGGYVGPAHIRAALEALYGPTPLAQGEFFDHTMLGTVVTVAPDGTHAAARTSQLAQLGRNGEWARWEVGTYENSFVKEDGVWKLEAVRYFPRVATDYDQGWALDAQPLPAALAGLPPDRAPESYASYPDTELVALHFRNPASGAAVRYPAGARARVPAAAAGGARARSVPADPGAALAAVEREIDRAIGVDATENLMSSYGYYIDESDWNGMADTYSATRGEKEITGAGTYIGRERIRTVLNLRGPTTGRSPNFFTIHQLTQPVIHVSEDGTKANARLRLFQSGGNADGSSGSWISGIYENTAVLEDGEWKLGRQDLTHNLNASYRNGWARVGAAFRAAAASAPAAAGTRVASAAGAAPAAAASRATPGGGITQGLGGARTPNAFVRDFPPDKPIRARQYAFPDIVEPAFHYVNPVSGRKPKELLP